MKTIISLLSLIFLMSCASTQSNIKIDSIDTFSLDNYNDFNIKINDSNLSAEVNPIVLEQFKEKLKNFDILIASGFYNLFNDPIKYLKKSLRHLKKDGNVFIFQRLNSYPIETRYFTRAPGKKKWKDERILYHYKYFKELLPNNKVRRSKKWDIKIPMLKK